MSKCSMSKKIESLKKCESLKSLRKKDEFNDWADNNGVVLDGERYDSIVNCTMKNDAPGYCGIMYFPDNPGDVTPDELQKISTYALDVINNLRGVKTYRDYIGTDVSVDETGEGEVSGYVFLKDNAWDEDLDDVKFMWQRVVQEFSAYCKKLNYEAFKNRALS